MVARMLHFGTASLNEFLGFSTKGHIHNKKARLGKALLDKARLGKTLLDKARLGKAWLDKVQLDFVRQS